MPEGLRAYMDAYQGQFSRKLAEWAISKMERRSPVGDSKEMVTVKMIPLEAVLEALKNAGVHVSEECTYTAWYLWHMAVADYPRTCDNDNRRAWFVDETINDPDGKPSNVLACFRAKMDNAGCAIMWERMI
jgi:hypothetical protein